MNALTTDVTIDLYTNNFMVSTNLEINLLRILIENVKDSKKFKHFDNFTISIELTHKMCLNQNVKTFFFSE